MSAAIVGLVFLATFVLLAARRLGRIPLARGPVALAGGLLMLLLGAVPPREAFLSIDWGTIALVLGMMIIGAMLAEAGFFQIAAGWIARAAGSERRLVIGTLWGSAVLSALFLNDTIALLLPPVLFIVLRSVGVPAFRTLAATALGVNIGSLWTPVGNPQNAYLATVHAIPFSAFVVHMTPLVLFGLTVSSLILAPGASTARFSADPGIKWAAPRALLATGVAALGVTLLLFLFSGVLDMPLWLIALSMGTLVLLLAPAIGGADRTRAVLSRVDGNLLLLFIGLFLLIDGARSAGIVDALFAAIPLDAATPLEATARITLLTLVLSNLFSNVPAVLLLDPMVATLHPEAPLLLAAASTLAGNTMVLASAATVIIAEQAEAHGERFPFWRFVRVGLSVTLVTLAATVLYFAWMA